MFTRTSWWSAAVPAIVVGVALSSANLPRYRHLAQEGVRVDAVVTSGCEDGFFRFTFEAGQRTWPGRNRASRAGVNCAALVPGARVPVYYRPDAPAEHAATRDPAALARQEVLMVAAFTIVALAGGVAMVWLRRRRMTAKVFSHLLEQP
jgi:hypothetical protein